MRRMLMTLMLLLTLSNLAAAAYACICSDPKLGTTCTGTYCRTRPGGGCECQDEPFKSGGGGDLAEEMMLAY